MTSEAAYAKLVTLLSRYEDPDEVADLVQLDFSGEQSRSVFNFHFGPGQTIERAKRGSKRGYFKLLKVERENGAHALTNEGVVTRFVQLRLLGVTPHPAPDVPGNATNELDAYLVSRDHSEQTMATLVANHQLRWSDESRATVNCAFDITFAKGEVLSKGTILKLVTWAPIGWSAATIVVHADLPAGYNG